MSEPKRPSEEELAALRAKHGELQCIESEHIVAYLRKATRGQYKAFKADQDSEIREVRLAAMERLFRGMCVYPTVDEIEKILDEHPAAIDDLRDPLSRHMGFTGRAQLSKS